MIAKLMFLTKQTRIMKSNKKHKHTQRRYFDFARKRVNGNLEFKVTHMGVEKLGKAMTSESPIHTYIAKIPSYNKYTKSETAY